MDFQTSVKTCLNKYATFSGRAQRSEYWWFALFLLAGSILLTIVDNILGMGALSPLSSLFSLATLIPSLAAGCRRLHDIDKSGWWQLLIIIPLIGWIILIIWFVKVGSSEENQHGPAIDLNA